MLLADHYISSNDVGHISTTANNNNSHTINLLSKYSVPSHMSWTVIIGHFGRDSLTGYSGEK